MTLNQRVPSKAVGGMAQWSRAFGGRQSFSVGTDWRWVDGDSEEDGLDATTGTQVTLKRISGGTQRSIGVFVQDVIAPTDSLTLTLSARVDQWRNYDGHNLEAAFPSGVPTANNAPSLPDRDDTVLQPAHRRALPPHLAAERVGGHRRRLPRADAQRALSPVPRRHGADAGEQSARAGAAGRRRARRQLHAAARTSCCGRPTSTTASRIRSRT